MTGAVRNTPLTVSLDGFSFWNIADNSWHELPTETNICNDRLHVIQSKYFIPVSSRCNNVIDQLKCGWWITLLDSGGWRRRLLLDNLGAPKTSVKAGYSNVNFKKCP